MFREGVIKYGSVYQVLLLASHETASGVYDNPHSILSGTQTTEISIPLAAAQR